jgi:hypothetical protein
MERLFREGENIGSWEQNAHMYTSDTLLAQAENIQVLAFRKLKEGTPRALQEAFVLFLRFAKFHDVIHKQKGVRRDSSGYKKLRRDLSIVIDALEELKPRVISSLGEDKGNVPSRVGTAAASTGGNSAGTSCASEVPPARPTAGIVSSGADGPDGALHAHGTSTSALLPLPPGWEVRLDRNGKEFYVDLVNRRTSWAHPAASSSVGEGSGQHASSVDDGVGDEVLAQAFVAAEAGGAWEFEESPRDWRPMKNTDSQRLTAALLAGKATESTRFGGFEYDVDFSRMTQTNRQTKRARRVRCHPCAGAGMGVHGSDTAAAAEDREVAALHEELRRLGFDSRCERAAERGRQWLRDRIPHPGSFPVSVVSSRAPLPP